MKKLLIAFTALTFGLTACQKEDSFENPNGSGSGGGTVDALLKRLVYAAGADSIATDMTYDGANRLISLSTVSTQNGNQSVHLYRNGSGILTRYTIKGNELTNLGIDSLVTDVKYDASKSQYTYSLSTIDYNGVAITDSTAFGYSGANLVTKTSFAKGGPAPYTAYGKTEYAYTGSNILTEKYFSAGATSGTWDPDTTYTYMYDDKINPLKVGPEGLIALTDFTLASAPYGSASNATKTDFVDHTDNTNNFSFTSTYTYNSSNKPKAGTATLAPSQGGYELRYYYQ